MKLSIVVPAFDEMATIARVLERVADSLPGIEKEIIIVDDCSNDGTRDWLRRNISEQAKSFTKLTVGEDRSLQLRNQKNNGATRSTIRAIFHEHNRGKGGALQTGLAAVTGEIVVIQDADLEYDPNDWLEMYDLIAGKGVADVVYGSRFYGRPHRVLYFHHYLGNRLISFIFNALYDQQLSDIEVCYKMFTKEVLDTLQITCDDFGFEVQITAQITLARRWRIYEVGIAYYGRTYEEGKKITWKDGIKALWYLLKFRISSV